MTSLPPFPAHPVHPVAINARTASRLLELEFDNGKRFEISFELMRVYSPSAEVRGHGEGQETLQTGKRMVSITGIEPVGNYAIKPLFTDDHSTGIFTWAYLYWLGEHQTLLWQDYMRRLQAAGFAGDSGRDVQPAPKRGSSCGK